MTPRDVLLEVLSDPLLGACVAPAEEQLKRLAAEEFAAAGLVCGPAEAYGTSRRLVLYVPGVPTGPAAKSLARALARVLARLDLPHAAAWEPSGFSFPVPVRGLAALHGERLIPFSAAGLRAGRVTLGQEALGPRSLKLASAERYFKAMEHAAVLVRDADRLQAMRGALEAASRRMKLEIAPEEGALLGNLYLAEYPVPVVSGFPQEFLSLPASTLRSALRELLFFPVSDAAGRLQPYFAGFRDGISKGQRNVEEGFRAALEASLRRAR
jgi:glycyl-tRNA synthetase beta chain